MDLLRLEHFSGCVNDTFHAGLAEGEVPFVLVEARELPMQRVPGLLDQRVPFSLLFRNTASFLLPQKIYEMRHDRIGSIGIFLVPIARERDGFLYQAVFN